MILETQMKEKKTEDELSLVVKALGLHRRHGNGGSLIPRKTIELGKIIEKMNVTLKCG